VHICPDCGNRDMRVRTADGATIHECGLCGGRFGDRRAVETLADQEQAQQRGVPPLVWPLVRVLEQLGGLHVREAVSGDTAPPTLPLVELGVADHKALLQIENLVKSLQLGASALRCHWVVEVEYRRHLAFVLKPRHGGGPVASEFVRDAQLDLEPLRRHVERDRRLGWWRHASDEPNR
jgi:hypothetical protein